MNNFTVDMVAGTLAGTAQLAVGHPFDTIKVKLQSQKPGQFAGPVDAALKTMRKEGMKGMYKGMGAPLATVAVFNAILFSTRGLMERVLKHSDGSPLTVNDQIVAGMGAGVAVSFMATPTELLKCRLQAQGCYKTAVANLKTSGINPLTVKLYRGPLDVARHVVKTEGGPLALYRGLNATLFREIPGNAMMFGAYEASKIYLMQRQGLSRVDELGTGSLLLAGGVGGIFFWLVMYPMDVIKSKIQVDNVHKPMYRGIVDCASKVYKAEGTPGLFRGFAPCMARSFPANAACFLVYEWISKSLSS